MFSLYRRHEQSCPHRDKGIRHIRCSCPIWMDGHDDHGKRRRRSLKTRDWRHAGDILDRIETGRAYPSDPIDHGITLAKAGAAYLEECRIRNLAESTIVSYEKLLEHLEKHFPQGIRLKNIDVDGLSKFRSGRKIDDQSLKAATQIKELGHLRAFFNFCVAREWINRNPAKALKPPINNELPTLPFEDHELAGILAACDRIDNLNQEGIERARIRARALILLLIYSGLRISDAVKLERSALNTETGALMIRVMKTRIPMYIKLRPEVLVALAALPVESKYFFWSGTAKLSTAVGSARRTITCVMKLAKVNNGHPHRFRDTFSVGLLREGVDLRTVQLLLGHNSIKTTERHYGPFVLAIQKQLDNAVEKLDFGTIQRA